MDRIRVSCHQIGTQTFARRQAGGNAGLQRKERCFILLAQTEENLAANGQILAAVAGPACLHRVLPIKDVIIVNPVACLAIGADILVYLSGVCSAELNAFCALKGSPADRTQGRQCGFRPPVWYFCGSFAYSFSLIYKNAVRVPP